MMNALGLLEVNGLTASIEAADTMLKTAAVRLVNQTITSPGLVTLVIEGDLAACRAALDAGAAAASRLGQVLVKKEIGRPEADTEWFVTSFNKSAVSVPKKVEPKPTRSANLEPVVAVEVKGNPLPIETIEIEGASASSPIVEVDVKDVPSPHEVAEFSETALLTYITNHAQGRNVTDIINHFNVSRAEIKSMLKDCISQGKIHKRGNRYYFVDSKK